MKTSVSRSDFHDAFRRIRPHNFSYDAIDALFDYLEQMEEGIGTEIELDVVSICCDFCEDTIPEIIEKYGLDGMDDSSTADDVREYLEYHTIVVQVLNDSIVYANF
jgi:hypothetical protein